MENLVRLDKLEQFQSLKRGDIIIVRWTKQSISHHPSERGIAAMKEYELYYIVEAIHRRNEIICRTQGNHFFNYNRYLKGMSAARDVFFIAQERGDLLS